MVAQFVTIAIGSHKEVIGALESYEIQTEKRVENAIRLSCLVIFNQAIRDAPVSSGSLISKIFTDVQEKNGWIWGRVRSKARYSLYQEVGTGLVGANTFKGDRPDWHRYQQPALKELVYTKFGWAQRAVRWRAGWGGRDRTQKRHVTGTLVKETMGIHDPPPIGKIKAWASLHGLNPYALRTTIYRNQGIPAHPFLFPADKAEKANFEERVKEAIGG